ncbi:uncharacterized protein LOC116010921 [Ipomoea triloba]|uniref:uncharacterized protein LOC116010921 n=1 Tax=Ipomoea triloba TaxID=35885 RepID=UPI00125D7454|nr:uncharacterized protein LOC116010921 [Ipomoea triloba]
MVPFLVVRLCWRCLLMSDEASSVASTISNPAYAPWMQQDQAILSMLISSLSEEVMPLVIALASSSRARVVHLLGQLQTLRQGDASVADYLGRVKVLLEDLVFACCPVSVDEQNIYTFRGLRPKFRPFTASLSTRATPVSLEELSDLLGAQEFVHAEEFSPATGGAAPVVHVACRGGAYSGSRLVLDLFRSSGVAVDLICSSTSVIMDMAHMVYQDAPNSGVPLTSQTWFLDTGATDHATPDGRVLIASDDYTGSDTLRVGNGKALPISSVGYTSFSIPSKSFSMSRVLHVHGLSASLLSV